MKSWIIVPLMAALALARINCPIYNCELNFANKESCYRQSYINGNISLQLHSCLDNKVCDIQQSSSDAEQGTCAKAYSAPISYPGEYCRNSSECYSTQCVNSTCVGLSKDSACVSDADCAAGLYCLSATCQPALKEGEACDATHRCMSNLVCDSGSCVLIGSRKVGTIASMPGACETMYVFNGKCAAGPTLKTSVGLTNSPEDGQCVYAFSEGKTITKEPTCGMTSKGKTFCNPGIGDVKIANYVNYIANTKGLGEKCHVSRGALCMHKEFKKMDPTYYKAYIAYMKAFRGAIYMENEECVKNVINKAYWDSMAQVNEEEESSEDHAMRYYILAASIVLVFVVALVLFHCYYKSQPTEGEGEDGGEDTLKISSSTKNP